MVVSRSRAQGLIESAMTRAVGVKSSGGSTQASTGQRSNMAPRTHMAAVMTTSVPMVPARNPSQKSSLSPMFKLPPPGSLPR